MERLSAPERTREELSALMNGDLGTAAGRGDLVRLALRLIVEEALEGEVADVLGPNATSAAMGKKGRLPQWLSAGQGEDRGRGGGLFGPRVRDTPKPFISGVRAALSGRTRELEAAGGRTCARGLSTRDIEFAFTDDTGGRLLSRAAVSEITEKLWAE